MGNFISSRLNVGIPKYPIPSRYYNLKNKGDIDFIPDELVFFITYKDDMNQIIFYLNKSNKSIKIEVINRLLEVVNWFILKPCYYEKEKDMGHIIIDHIMTEYRLGNKNIHNIILSEYSEYLYDYQIKNEFI